MVSSLFSDFNKSSLASLNSGSLISAGLKRVFIDTGTNSAPLLVSSIDDTDSDSYWELSMQNRMDHLTTDEDTHLVEQAQSGDHSAFAELIRRYRPACMKLALS